MRQGESFVYGGGSRGARPPRSRCIVASHTGHDVPRRCRLPHAPGRHCPNDGGVRVRVGAWWHGMVHAQGPRTVPRLRVRLSGVLRPPSPIAAICQPGRLRVHALPERLHACPPAGPHRGRRRGIADADCLVPDRHAPAAGRFRHERLVRLPLQPAARALLAEAPDEAARHQAGQHVDHGGDVGVPADRHDRVPDVPRPRPGQHPDELRARRRAPELRAGNAGRHDLLRHPRRPAAEPRPHRGNPVRHPALLPAAISRPDVRPARRRPARRRARPPDRLRLGLCRLDGVVHRHVHSAPRLLPAPATPPADARRRDAGRIRPPRRRRRRCRRLHGRLGPQCRQRAADAVGGLLLYWMVAQYTVEWSVGASDRETRNRGVSAGCSRGPGTGAARDTRDSRRQLDLPPVGSGAHQFCIICRRCRHRPARDQRMTLEDKRREAARLRQEALSPDSELLPTRKEAESLPYDTPVAEDQQERPVVEGKAEKRAGGEGKPTLLNKSDIRKLRRAMKLEEECQQAAGGERPEA
ncbi:unnamed protein product (mitochondrion) [Plasmodiophora brassicae]|uniref:Uncharacterized protein n=1 Tax=Plasmodiophora brassicae TaxID=37360 RepID=A0A3P3YE33_PLABS|nr:unnamed protein product [Plasmodiophora brassicae]